MGTHRIYEHSISANYLKTYLRTNTIVFEETAVNLISISELNLHIPKGASIVHILDAKEIIEKCNLNYGSFIDDYADVRVGKPYQFPCLKQAGDCSKFAQLTSEEVEQEIRDIEAVGSEMLSAYVKVREHFTATKEHAGKLPCECGGVLHYSVAKGNGHIWAKCDTCTVSFME